MFEVWSKHLTFHPSPNDVCVLLRYVRRRRFQDSTGYMPRANGQRSFDNLRTVFGATPVNLTPEYKEVELYIRHLVSKNARTG